MQEIIEKLDIAAKKLRVAVIGDVMLDENIEGPVTRISPEAPVVVLSRYTRRIHAGGAANVAAGVLATGASCHLIGLVGEDGAAEELDNALSTKNPELYTSKLIVDSSRPTTVKTRFWGSGHGPLHQLFRVDREHTHTSAGAVQDKLLESIRTLQPRNHEQGYDCIIVSDYAKGAINEKVMQTIISTGITVIAAPKPANGHLYSGVDVILPNLSEATALSGASASASIESIAQSLQQRFSRNGKTPIIVITQGKEGIFALEPDGQKHHEAARPLEVFDVTGAGDTVLAIFSLAIAAQYPLPLALAISNIAAGVKVSKTGAATITFSEMRNALSRY